MGFEIFAQACGIRLMPFSSCRSDFARRQYFCYALFWRCGRRGGEESVFAGAFLQERFCRSVFAGAFLQERDFLLKGGLALVALFVC